MLTELQRILIRSLTTDEPLEALRRAGESASPELRERLNHIDAEGFRLSQVIVAKLRFERIYNGDVPLRKWFEQDPAAFTNAFRSYQRDVPPQEYFPQQEASCFREFCVRMGLMPREFS